MNPLAALRLAWIYLNMGEDERLDFEMQKAHAEYIGMFAGPEIYMRIKGIAQPPKESSQVEDPFRIVVDTTPFTQRMNKAMAGEVVINPPRPDVAEKVQSKRIEAELRTQKADPRIRQYPVIEQKQPEQMDSLIVERPQRKPNG